MKKETQMLKEKDEGVNVRKDMIRKACDSLLSNSTEIFKGKKIDIRTAIYELTMISIRTLENNIDYSGIINGYIVKSKECESGPIKILKKEIEYKNRLISQLRKQNKALGTKLLMEDKI